MYGETRVEKENTIAWDRFLVQVLKKYAKKNNLKITLFSGDWIIKLKNKNKIHYIFGLDLGLNSSSSKLIARDKSALSDILSFHKIPVLKHELFLRPGSTGAPAGGIWEKIKKTFKKYKKNVVCKPNHGGGGIDIFPAKNEDELEIAITELFVKHRAIAISPFIKIKNEYRITILNDEVLLIYKKEKEKDQFQHNLSKGAKGKIIKNKKLIKELSTLALKTAKATNLKLVNVDIVSVENKLLVMEVNSGLMFENFVRQGKKEAKVTEQIYFKALDTLFT